MSKVTIREEDLKETLEFLRRMMDKPEAGTPDAYVQGYAYAIQRLRLLPDAVMIELWKKYDYPNYPQGKNHGS